MATELLPLMCHQCGGPLSVPADVRFVTCAHCNTSLSVEHEGDAYFTRQLDALTEKTEQIDAKLGSVERQLKRQNLDLQWEIDRKKLLVKRKDGELAVPKRADSASSVFQLIFGGIFLMVFIAMASQAPGGAGAMFILFAVILGGALCFSAFREHDKALKYEQARRRYRNAKADLADD